MYGLDPSLNLDDIVGEDLSQIGLAKYSVAFHFGSGTFVSVQSRVTVEVGGHTVAVWKEEGRWTELRHQELVGQKVVGYSVKSRRLLQIEFENGMTLLLHDDSEQYESFQIYPLGRVENLIVV